MQNTFNWRMLLHSTEARYVKGRAVLVVLLLVLLITGFAAIRRWRTAEPAAAVASPYVPYRQVGDRRYYSQFYQDQWVIEEVFPGVTDGYFVDIGSGDGILTSNSKALEDLGWQGICIDPFPTNMEARKSQLFREVVYSSAGETIEFRDAGLLGGIEKHIDVYRDETSGAQVVRFKTTTIGDILERAQAPAFIHYISLDTEGSELEILKAFPFDRHTVGAFTIEHNFVEDRRRAVRSLLEKHGYRFVAEMEVDDFFRRDDGVQKADDVQNVDGLRTEDGRQIDVPLTDEPSTGGVQEDGETHKNGVQ